MITLQQRSRRLSADLETPISLFLSLTQNKIPGLLLESAEVDGRWGRYSIIACDYLMTVSCVNARLSLFIEDDRLASLKELEGMPYLDGLRVLMQRLELVGDDMRQAPITRALYGYFGYETAALFQPRLAQAIPASSAESCLVLAGTVIVFDHLYNRLTQLSLGEHRDLSHAPLHGAEEPSIGEVSRTPDQAAYMKGVEHIKELLHDGEAIQVVLSSQASAEFHGDAFMLYRRMRSINPSPYMFFMRLPEVTLFGSSPELMVRCTDGKLQLSPIAGTRRRGRDDEEDAALAADLLKDPKECSEHVMLVDLGRNDLGRIARPGTVNVERLMEVERFSHVMHLTSRIAARLQPDLDALDVLAKLGGFTVLGHLTLPLRYFNEMRGLHTSFDPYEAEIREILKTLIENGRGIELNVNRGNTPLPDAKWLRIYRELGGELITLGTDAHSPEHVGRFIRERQTLLKECGFTRFCTFEKQMPVWHAL